MTNPISKIGTIPQDWEIRKIGDIAPLQRGFDLPNNQIKDGIYPVVYSNGIGSFHNEYKVKAPGVVTGRSGTLGKIHYIEKDFWAHNTTLWVTNFNNAIPKFIYYLFQKVGFTRFASGSGVPTLNRNDAHEFKIALPKSTAEQTAIAAVLSDTDALIQALENLLTKKRAIKTAHLQALLTGKMRLAPFSTRNDGTAKTTKQSELGTIPEDWEVVELGDVGEIITGSTPSTLNTEFWNGEIAWITPTDISEAKNIYFGERNITQKGLNSIRTLPKNTLLVTCIASIGKNAILRTIGACNQQINAVIPNKNFNVDFLYYVLENEKIRLKGIAGITATPIISKALFSEFKIPIPKSTAEQTAIAQILSDMDNEIRALSARLDKLRGVKTALMQQLLSGTIRLVG